MSARPSASAPRCPTPCDAVVIEELVLRVPGVRRDDAPAIVRDVLGRVQRDLLRAGRVGRYHVAKLEVRVPARAGRDELVDAIARELTEALR